jgi:hypothetical protein
MPDSSLRAAPQDKIPSPKKSPPFLSISFSLTATELVEVHGLHGLFWGFRAINAKRNAKLHNNGIISVFHPDGQGISLKKLII